MNPAQNHFSTNCAALENTFLLIKTTRNAALLLISVAGLLAGGLAAVRGQSALDGFGPNADGPVNAIVVQPDGKVLFGGNFTALSPNGVTVTRNRIARVNPDGTLDAGFNPNASAFVSAIVLQADGKILVGGAFTNIAGTARNRIARLNPDGTIDSSFNPNANSTVRSFALQADGKILAGGDFSGTNSIGGATRNYIARLDATTGLADSFNPNANGTVRVLAVQADGKILVGGSFTGTNSIGGATRKSIARLDASTGLADSFNPNATGNLFDPNATGIVYAFVMQADGKILVGGSFTSIGGQARNCIARLDATTGMADSFNPNADYFGVYSIGLQADGKILAGGDFGSIGGQNRGRIARLDATTGLADSFDPNVTSDFSPSVNAIAVQPDGKILIGGTFNKITANGASGAETLTVFNIARLETDGRPDRILNLNIPSGVVYATAIQRDGKILIGGNFTNVLGVTRKSIARLNTDGTLDAAFNPNALYNFTASVEAIAVQPDGKVVVGGSFTNIGGQPRNYIARLDGTTGLADSFNPNANNPVRTIVLQTDGKILVGGVFGNIGGQTRSCIARLNSATGLADPFNPNVGAGTGVYSMAVQEDGKILVGGHFNTIGGVTRNYIARLDPVGGGVDSFNPNASFIVYAIAVQTDGKILAGGQFADIGGQARNFIARLDSNTGAADSFNPNANDIVYSIALQTDGKILTAGSFTNIGGATRNRFARLDATNGLADSFDLNANGTVYSVSEQADGKILAGGSFTNIGGQVRNRFARLLNDTPSPQNLSVSQNTVTWTRGGSGPQFNRVMFESSIDNVNYSSLGDGTVSGSNWTLVGLNLPTSQNIYIRARGFYRSGVYNGSESVIESVRNAIIAPTPPLLNIQRSATANVILSWATNSSGFTLESKTNLNTNVWSVVLPGPTVSGTNNVVTNTVSGSARFYRLRQ